MASPRERAASMATARFSFTFFWPINSASRCGRSFSSKEESSPSAAAETRRSRLGSAWGWFLALATSRDSRTKCESAQLFRCAPRALAGSVRFRVPVEQADLDAGSLQILLKNRQVGSPIVVGDHNFRTERLDCVGCFFGRHGVGQIHADKGHVDVPERAHLRDALGVA